MWSQIHDMEKGSETNNYFWQGRVFKVKYDQEEKNRLYNEKHTLYKLISIFKLQEALEGGFTKEKRKRYGKRKWTNNYFWKGRV